MTINQDHRFGPCRDLYQYVCQMSFLSSSSFVLSSAENSILVFALGHTVVNLADLGRWEDIRGEG